MAWKIEKLITSQPNDPGEPNGR